ncbi:MULTISPECIES: Fur family transcriptional regulator [unclassified Nitratiruptor]|uniref:Fur family transcriptional regulator n=1 Tax=unclassified Nitratiruptor TaxID=2624044 RepID=UPI0019158BB6|nr:MULTISPECIES: transcriptional repressor [unclassified Nitratiruptor]BCD60127.1 Fur family transcriptional regulator, peroxide stress response regulator [Nitratiruptor sp. YY08-10]BCD64384.1 Fur family transcriptional regulator, peroxide stress response regulator [Nitratiruptor sp. YY08-14]
MYKCSKYKGGKVENRYQIYTDMLKSKELKSTPQRVAMLNILDQKGHADIEDIYSEIKKEFVTISLATVYKNINTMLDSGIIQEIKIPYRKSKFEVTKHKHSHFVCQKCGEVYDIDEPKCLEIELPEGFKPTESSVMILGICDKCQ